VQRTAQRGIERAVQLGAAAEEVVQRHLAVAKNVLERFGNRIPDFVDHAEHVIAEVKNVAYLANTKQLQQMFEGARQAGYRIVLFTRGNLTRLSKPLQDAIARYEVNVQTIPPNPPP
jgi:phosphoserine phosphatase